MVAFLFGGLFYFNPFNIFVTQNSSILEKITKEFIQKFLSENEIELSCTHAKLCIPIIDRIYRKMIFGIIFAEIKVDENLICDGHHRYVASLLARIPVGRIPSAVTSATDVINWESVVFVEEDWDTLAKINMLNEQDAQFNNIAVEELIELLK